MDVYESGKKFCIKFSKSAFERGIKMEEREISLLLKDETDEDSFERCDIDFISMELRFSSESSLPPASLDSPFYEYKAVYSFYRSHGRVSLLWESDNHLGFWNNDPLKNALKSIHVFGKFGDSKSLFSLLDTHLQKHQLKSLPRDQISFFKLFDSFYSEVCSAENYYQDFQKQADFYRLTRPCRTKIEKSAEKIILHAHSGKWEYVHELLSRFHDENR